MTARNMAKPCFHSSSSPSIQEATSTSRLEGYKAINPHIYFIRVKWRFLPYEVGDSFRVELAILGETSR